MLRSHEYRFEFVQLLLNYISFFRIFRIYISELININLNVHNI